MKFEAFRIFPRLASPPLASPPLASPGMKDSPISLGSPPLAPTSLGRSPGNASGTAQAQTLGTATRRMQPVCSRTKTDGEQSMSAGICCFFASSAGALFTGTSQRSCKHINPEKSLQRNFRVFLAIGAKNRDLADKPPSAKFADKPPAKLKKSRTQACPTPMHRCSARTRLSTA